MFNTGLFGENFPSWKDMTINYLVDFTRELPFKLTSTVFSLLKWTHTYILIHPAKYCGSKIMKIPSLDKEFILQHCDHGFSLSIQGFFIESVEAKITLLQFFGPISINYGPISKTKKSWYTAEDLLYHTFFLLWEHKGVDTYFTHWVKKFN